MSQRKRKYRKRNFWSIFYRNDSPGSRITGSRSLTVGSGDLKPRKSLKERWKQFKRIFFSAGNSDLDNSRKGKKEKLTLKSIRKILSAYSLDGSDSQKLRKNSKPNKYILFLKQQYLTLILIVPCLITSLVNIFIILTHVQADTNFSLSYSARFESAVAEKNLKVAETLLKKQAGMLPLPNDNILLDYASIKELSGNDLIADQIYQTLALNTTGINGQASLHIARKYLNDSNQSVEMKLLLERMLLRAMADKRVEPAVRLELGRFYRSNERLNDAARILDPLRKIEESAIELCTIRLEQKEFNEIEIILTPFLLKWQQQLSNPTSELEFDHAMTGLTILKDEKRVIDTIKRNPRLLSPLRQSELTRFAIKCWMDRLLREGQRAFAEIITIVNTYEPEISCSNIWFRPLMQIALSDSPLNKDAIGLVNNLILKEKCSAAYLLEILIEVKSWGDLKQAEKVADLMIEKYPDETESLLNSALEFERVEPRNPGKALEILDQLILRKPDLSTARLARAEIRIKNNLFSEAISDLLTTSKSNQLYPEFHLRIASLYRKIKDETSAMIHEELASELSIPASQKPSK